MFDSVLVIMKEGDLRRFDNVAGGYPALVSGEYAVDLSGVVIFQRS
jgi:hypothetical protein